DLGRDPATLSAGRQQCVLLAAALVARPRLLVADEPMAHVDAAGRERIREALLAEARATGLAMVTATQARDDIAAPHRPLPAGGRRGAPAPGLCPRPAASSPPGARRRRHCGSGSARRAATTGRGCG